MQIKRGEVKLTTLGLGRWAFRLKEKCVLSLAVLKVRSGWQHAYVKVESREPRPPGEGAGHTPRPGRNKLGAGTCKLGPGRAQGRVHSPAWVMSDRS